MSDLFSSFYQDALRGRGLLPKSPSPPPGRKPAKMGNRKFKLEDEVIVTDTNNKHVGELGTIYAYDMYALSYKVEMENGDTRTFKASQLAMVGNISFQAGDKVMLPFKATADGRAAPNNTLFISGEVLAAHGGYIVVQADRDAINEHTNSTAHDNWGDTHTIHKSDGSKTIFFNTWAFKPEALQHISKIGNGKPKTVDFDTVVIAENKRQQILEALEQINQTDLIFNVWGFGKTMEKGKGVSMLFYGLPGTGKTLMAQSISEKLGYTLKIITTAEIESSEPGQAERNIQDIFSNAKGKKVVLLFDECDSLIFDRRGLGPILGGQVNQLLSCLEKFDGITIFTTNQVETLDEAVNRRLALKLEFEMPTQAERVEIWKRMFPPECPLDDNIDFERLAEVEIAGGHIKNSVLRAARIAALEMLPDNQKKIQMKHLVRALGEEGTSMLAFHKAKEKFNVSGYNHGGRQIGHSGNLDVSKITEMVAQMGSAYE